MTRTDSPSPSIGSIDLKKKPGSPRTLFSSFMSGVAVFCALLALIPLVAVLSYVLIKGIPVLSPSLFFQLPPPPLTKGGGFGNAVLGTLLTVGIASLISIPFGILAGIYLSEYSDETPLEQAVNFCVNVLSGVPSIVMGTFAYALIVIKTGTYSAVAGGVALAVLMLPTIIRTASDAMESVPSSYRQASYGLGATPVQTTLKVVFPAALPAILTGIILAIARAAGETAPVLFTALFNQYWNRTVWEPTATLSVLAYNFAIVPYKNQQDLAWAAALVLIVLVLITNVLARRVIRRRG